MNIAMVTGGTSGIGFEFAKEILRDKIGLVIIARDEKKLKEAKKNLGKMFQNPWIETICTELSTSESAQVIMDKFAKIQKKSEKKLEIQYLINNAGFGDFAQFSKADPAKINEMMMLNMVTLTNLTRLVLPIMEKQKHGRVLNVASSAGFVPGPFMATYYATKAFVLSLSEALAEEYRGSNITITALCPGPVKTGFQYAADMNESKIMKNAPMMSAEEVVDQGYFGMKQGKRIVVPGLGIKMFVNLPRFLPRSTTTWIIKKMQEKAEKKK
jgi:uncharacterized protein